MLFSGREPDRDVGRLERLLDRIDQISAHDVKINGLAQPHGKRGHYRFGVVMGLVEPPGPASPAALSRRYPRDAILFRRPDRDELTVSA